jgi:hypothetical protein
MNFGDDKIIDQDGGKAVTANNFNLRAASGAGYLGIQLDPTQQTPITYGAIKTLLKVNL